MDSKEPSTGGSAALTSTMSGGRDPADDGRDEDLIVDDVLVEDVSIDGMCGVY